MDGRTHRINQEAAELWRELFGEQPPAEADGRQMLDMITRNLDEKPYDRLRSPFLRPSTIAGPAQPEDDARPL